MTFQSIMFLPCCMRSISALKKASHHARLSGVRGNMARLRGIEKAAKYSVVSCAASEGVAGRSCIMLVCVGLFVMFSGCQNRWLIKCWLVFVFALHTAKKA